jgi:hypothetical protein
LLCCVNEKDVLPSIVSQFAQTVFNWYRSHNWVFYIYCCYYYSVISRTKGLVFLVDNTQIYTYIWPLPLSLCNIDSDCITVYDTQYYICTHFLCTHFFKYKSIYKRGNTDFQIVSDLLYIYRWENIEIIFHNSSVQCNSSCFGNIHICLIKINGSVQTRM